MAVQEIEKYREVIDLINSVPAPSGPDHYLRYSRVCELAKSSGVEISVSLPGFKNALDLLKDGQAELGQDILGLIPDMGTAQREHTLAGGLVMRIGPTGGGPINVLKG